MFASTALKKKKAAFEKEALPHLDALYGMGLKLTGNAGDAEDLVQDALLRGYRFFDRFEEGTNCKAWLFKILTNTFINKYRKKIREAEVVSGSTEDLLERASDSETSASWTDPERELFNKILGEKIHEALNEVPVDFRMVVVLADLEEFTYREIAEIMDCPIGTVMSRLYRGRRQVQGKLRNHMVAEGLIKEEAADERAEENKKSGLAKVTRLDEYRKRQAVM